MGAILFGVVLLILSDAWEVNEDWLIAAFLLIVAGAVWAFIYGGIQHKKYDIAKYNRDNNPTPEARRRNQLTGTVCAVIMLLAAAVYAGLGLALDLWRTAWWIFAVGGILCGAAAVVLAPREDK